jgi:hypothetical protein
MTNQHPPDDEETSVFTVVPQSAITHHVAPPSVMPPITPVETPGAPQAAAQIGPQYAPQYAPQYPPTVPAVAPPAVMPPLYPAYRPAAAPYGTSGRAVFAGLVLLIFGLIELVGGAAGAVAASSLRAVWNQLLKGEGIRVDGASLIGVLTLAFLILLLLGVLHIVAAGGVFGHKRWGRVLGVLLSVAGTVAGAWLLYRSLPINDARELVGLLLILVPYAISLLGLLFPRDHFRRAWSVR